MKKICLLIGCVCISNAIMAQNTKKQNPIIFMETLLGMSFGQAGGLSGGLGLNHQFNKNLFSIRYTGSINFDADYAVVGFVAFPVIRQNSTSEEFSALYGLRFTGERRSFSISAGGSYNKFAKQYENEFGERFKNRIRYLGFPYEFNVKWYRRYKERLRIYWIPVGKPTSLGPSFGFKLFGNFSKKSYVGTGITLGFGYHKKFNKASSSETNKSN